MSDFIINESKAAELAPLMPESCPRDNCMMVYDKQRCYQCSAITHNTTTFKQN